MLCLVKASCLIHKAKGLYQGAALENWSCLCALSGLGNPYSKTTFSFPYFGFLENLVLISHILIITFIYTMHPSNSILLRGIFYFLLTYHFYSVVSIL